MAKVSVSKVDFTIYYVTNGYSYQLPYAFYESVPIFKWDIPTGIQQYAYIFQMRSVSPVLYTDGVTYRCAYYNSSKIISSIPQHQLSLSMNSVINNGVLSTLDTWLGGVEIRLRIFDEAGNEYTSHDIITDTSIYYDFQTDHQQYRKWGSTNDGYYFCYDNTINEAINHEKIKFLFQKSEDVDELQDLIYTLQISQTVLFGQGIKKDSLIEINDITISNVEAKIDALFQLQKNPELLAEETINSLKPNTLYFCRVRAFDGYDYSDWSMVNAFKMVYNTIPQCHIWSIKYPMITNNEGVQVVDTSNRGNGQMIIELSIQDDDNDYASATLCFSMVTNEKEAEDLGCAVNDSTKALDYDSEISNSTKKSGLIRCRLKETLIKIPTSKLIGDKHLFVTWYTNKEIKYEKGISTGIKDSVYLYMAGNDGISEAKRAISDKFQIDNSKINNDSTSLRALAFWLRGNMDWGYWYPYLPAGMQRKLIVNNNPNASVDTTLGGHGYSWYDYWLKKQNATISTKVDERGSDSSDLNLYGLQRQGISRVTQSGNFTIKNWDKYADKQTGIIGYTQQTIASGNGFVSYCPYCNDLQILQTIIIKEDGTYATSISSAFINRYGFDIYDGQHYELAFKCPGCNKIFPMEWRYHDHLSYSGFMRYFKTCYSYWHGYNTDSKKMNDEGLINQLQLYRDGAQIDKIKQEYTQIYGTSSGLEETSAIGDNKNKDNGDVWKMCPDDKLKKLSIRPQIDSYFRVTTPRCQFYNFSRYFDGAQLNFDSKKDYMDPTKNTSSSKYKQDEEDSDMAELASQSPWKDIDKLSYYYTAGKDLGQNKQFTDVAFEKTDGVIGVNYTNDDETLKTSMVISKFSCGINLKFPFTIYRYTMDYKVIINNQEMIFNIIQKTYTTINQKKYPVYYYISGDTFIYLYCAQFNNKIKWIINEKEYSNIVTDNKLLYYCKEEVEFPELANQWFNQKNNIIDIKISINDETKKKNDMFKIVVNNKILYEGSILDTDYDDIFKCQNPYNIQTYALNGYEGNIIDFLNKMFGQYFNIDNSEHQLFPRYKTWAKTDEEYQNFLQRVDVLNKTIYFSIYGYSNSKNYKFQLKNCYGNCYDIFNIVPFITYQNHRSFLGHINDKNITYGNLSEKKHYYSNIKYEIPQFGAQESPIDNVLQTSYGVLSTQSTGQPMFTCYKDQVDKNGYHFKFTEEDYKKTGKIYVRRYHIQQCNPFQNGSLGYRNWIVVPIPGKSGRYYKKKILNTRGAPAVTHLINVKLGEKNNNSITVKQIGFFSPDKNGKPDKCLSHSEPQAADNNSIQTDIDEIQYTRKHQSEWGKLVVPTTCVVFDYVDAEQAITKNILDMQSKLNPFNHHCPIKINFGVYNVDIINKINRYGLYVMGGYKLSNDQLKLKNDGQSYQKQFSSFAGYYEYNEQGSQVPVYNTYMESMPNNYRPTLINTNLVTQSSCGQQISYIKYDNSSSISSVSVDTYARYKKTWNGKITIPSNAGQFSQLTVQQFAPSLRNSFKIYQKTGYESKQRIQDQWKLDEQGYYSGKYIPLSTRIVHKIYEDNVSTFRILSKIKRQRNIISDKTFLQVDDNYDKTKYIDYRLIGMNNLKECIYFSGYPRSLNAAYATRPDPPYGNDRQWRIGGFNVVRRSYNIYIDEQTSLTNDWNFYYFQDEFNTYSRLHWTPAQGQNDYLCIYAQQVSNGATGQNIGQQFSVKTKNAVWIQDEQLNISTWGIPYSKQMSDLIDIENSELKDGLYYVFIVDIINLNSHTITNQAFKSRKFLISKSSVSPATIVSNDYDPWTKMLTIKFRFDDALGRTYDIVGLQYANNADTESTTVWVPSDDNMSNYLGSVIGQLTNLQSNKYGDLASVDNLLKIHTIKINIGTFGIQSADSLRIKLTSALSSDRSGLTLPEFNVKLWANESLKPIEERLMSIQGYKNRWVWVDTIDETSNTSTGYWKYVSESEAIPILGSIQQNEEKIQSIEDDFNTWYYRISQFQYPDIDCFENYLNYNNLWNKFYYSYIFKTYIVYNKNNNYYDSYKTFANKYPGYYDYIVSYKWLVENNLQSDYKLFYQNHRLTFLINYRNDSTISNNFNTFYQNHKISNDENYKKVRQLYAQNHESSYDDYYNISSSSSSQSTRVFDDKSVMNFIQNKSLQNSFILLYGENAYYADTRFQQRALLLNRQYGVITEGLFQKSQKNITEDHKNKFTLWLSNKSFLNESKTNDEYYTNISDKYQMFLAQITGSNKNIQIITNLDTDKNKTITDTQVNVYDENNNIIKFDTNIVMSNYGKSLSRTAFMKSTSPTGFSYNQRYQSINNTLQQLYAELVSCKSKKNHIETDFRKNLIKQGYFCNGFQDNQPYKDNGDVNICFRWRVETESYQGTVQSNTIYDEQGNTTNGYQQRFNMYIRFQMDFYDSFDSQNGSPLRDILFVTNNNTNEEQRILASIKVTDGQVRTTPDSTPTAQATVDIPTSISDTLLVDNNQQSYTYSAYDINDLQLSANFGIARNNLPGKLITDKLPAQYKDCWGVDDNGLFIDTFKNAYYWRIAPYNVIEIPFFDTMIGYATLSQPSDALNIKVYSGKKIVYEQTAILHNIYHSKEIENGTIEIDKNFCPIIYIAISKLDVPLWKTNKQISYFDANNEQIFYFDENNVVYNNDWINKNKFDRGQVQFITDRPRSVTVPIKSSSSSSSSSEQKYKYYIISIKDTIDNIDKEIRFQQIKNTYTKVQNKKYYIYSGTVNNVKKYLYCGYLNNKVCWFIGNSFTSNQIETGLWDYCIENVSLQSDNTLSFDNLSYIDCPDLSELESWYKQGYKDQSNIVSIKITRYTNIVDEQEQIVSSSSTQQQIEEITDYSTYEVSWIDDNINNYDTIWYPFSNIRKKPFIIFTGKEYLLFSHKIFKTGYVKNTSGVKLEYNCNAITLSRGFTNNIFGEQGLCLINYTDEKLTNIINDALSFQNPCLLQLPDGTWRMYFNVMFFDNTNFYTRIYKADTVDFDEWINIEEVKLLSNAVELINCIEPNVNISYELVNEEYVPRYYMYAVKKNETDNIYTIRQFYSIDGIKFNYKNEIHQVTDGSYNCHSPFLVNIDNYKKKLYFTIESYHDVNNNYSSLIVSLQSDENGNWRTQEYDKSSSRFMIEKGNGNVIYATDEENNYIYDEEGNKIINSSNEIINTPFCGDFGTNSHFSNPCIIMDYNDGCKVLRLYYNTYDIPYLWRVYEYQDDESEQQDNTKQLILANGLEELTIHTEYLEEYKWATEVLSNGFKEWGTNNYYNNYEQVYYRTDDETKYINLVQYASDTKDISIDEETNETIINWHNLDNFIYNIFNGWEKSCYYPVSEQGISIKFNWLSSYKNIYAIRFKTGSVNKIKECLSQGEWIGFDNVADTQATLYPELLKDLSYDINNYSAIIYISEQELSQEYLEWKSKNQKNNDSESTVIQFLIDTKRYPKYIWWSRKGQGIYRYVGANLLSEYSWINN